MAPVEVGAVVVAGRAVLAGWRVAALVRVMVLVVFGVVWAEAPAEKTSASASESNARIMTVKREGGKKGKPGPARHNFTKRNKPAARSCRIGGFLHPGHSMALLLASPGAGRQAGRQPGQGWLNGKAIGPAELRSVVRPGRLSVCLRRPSAGAMLGSVRIYYQPSLAGAAFFTGLGAALGALAAAFGLADAGVPSAPPAARLALPEAAVSTGAGAAAGAGAGAAMATSVGRGGQGLGRRTLRLERRSRTAAASSAITLRPPRSCTGVPGATEIPKPPVAAEEPPPPPPKPPAAGAGVAAGSGAAADISGAGAGAAPPFWRDFWPAACDALLLVVFLAGLFLGVSHPLGASQPP